MQRLTEEITKEHTPDVRAGLKSAYKQHADAVAKIQRDYAALTGHEALAYNGIDVANLPGELPKQTDSGEPSVSLTPEGLDMAARVYGQTGMTPSLGMGKSGANTRVSAINRAAELFPGANVVENKVATAADAKSLAGLQVLYDNATAFENTALANSKVLLTAMQKIRSTNSPLLNKPLRSIDKNALNPEEMAAYNTALAVVQPEFAKLLSSPAATGVLTDASQKEAKALLDGSYSLRSMARAIKVLYGDAENKRKAYQGQVDAVHGRIQKRGAPTRPDLRSPVGKNGPRVRNKQTGQTGTLDSEAEFDPRLYERIQ